MGTMDGVVLSSSEVEVMAKPVRIGHKTIKMTLRYSHLSPTHTLEAVNKLCLTSQSGSTRTGTEKNERIA